MRWAELKQAMLGSIAGQNGKSASPDGHWHKKPRSAVVLHDRDRELSDEVFVPLMVTAVTWLSALNVAPGSSCSKKGRFDIESCVTEQ